MKTIEYYDNDDSITHIYTEDEFLKEAYSMPFELILSVAKAHETIRNNLYYYLLLKAKFGENSELLKACDFFDDLERTILTGKSEEEKMHLALFVDNNLIESYYNGIDSLVDRIINIDPKETMNLSYAEYLAQASNYTDNEETINKIRAGINHFVDRDYEELVELVEEFPFPNISIEKMQENREKFRQGYLGIVSKNVSGRHK